MSDARMRWLVLVALLMGLLIGCGGDKADSAAEGAADQATKMVETATDAAQEAGEGLVDAAAEAMEEIKDLSPGDLKARVNEVTEQIMGKEKKLQELKTKLEKFSASELTSDSAKSLKSESETLTKEIASLKDKLTVYTDKLTGGE